MESSWWRAGTFFIAETQRRRGAEFFLFSSDEKGFAKANNLTFQGNKKLCVSAPLRLCDKKKPKSSAVTWPQVTR
jgi:hypothetical protein